MPRLAVVCGLESEARRARRWGFPVAVSGARPEAALAAARRFAAEGASALLSFGLCGALAPGLMPGDLVIATAVLVGENRHAADPRLSNLLAERLPAAHLGAVLGSQAMLAAVADKAAWHGRTGAIAVDMESEAVVAAGLPFAVLRAVADPADRHLPPAALVGVTPAGKPDLPAVLRSLLAEPRQLPRLIALARETARALAALDRAIAANPHLDWPPL